MPTYVYECRTCGKTFEVEQRITEDPLTDCECGAKNSVKRVIQPVGIAFKGSGFHINDYAASKPTVSESASNSSPAAETSKAAEPAAPASTTETKPDSSTTSTTPTKSTGSEG